MYSKVDHKWLLETASAALNELERHSLNSIESSLTSSNVLPNEIKKTVKETISDINKKSSITGNIESLKFHLNKLVQAATKIKKYQSKEKEIKELKKTMDSNNSFDCRKLKKLQKELKTLEESIASILDKKENSLFW